MRLQTTCLQFFSFSFFPSLNEKFVLYNLNYCPNKTSKNAQNRKKVDINHIFMTCIIYTMIMHWLENEINIKNMKLSQFLFLGSFCFMVFFASQNKSIRAVL